MRPADLIEFFKQSPIFATLDEDELKKIAGLATPRHFKKGEFIVLEGDTPPSFHHASSGVPQLGNAWGRKMETVK